MIDPELSVNDQTDFNEIVAAGLADRSEFSRLCRLYRRIAETPFAARLSQSVAGHFMSSRVATLAHAAEFFAKFPLATGSEQIVQLFEAQRWQLLRAERDPFQPTESVAFRLLHAAGSVLRSGDGGVRTVCRTAAVRPGGAAVAAALTNWDEDWTFTHLGEILLADPEAVVPILFQYRFGAVRGIRPWLEVVRAMPAASIRSSLWREIARLHLTDEEASELAVLVPPTT